MIGDAGAVLKAMLAEWRGQARRRRSGAAPPNGGSRSSNGASRDCLRYDRGGAIIKPQYALETPGEGDRGTLNAYITTEVGQHQMWAAQFLPFEEPNHWMTSGGLGTMGYGLPSADRRADWPIPRRW